ncbi:MAG: hypothetical protein R2806_11830 [Saprospiraceae bacterium]
MTLAEIEKEPLKIFNTDILDCLENNLTKIFVGLKVKQNFTYTDLLKTKYNDCWIEVRKDDKEPPVVQAPEDITVYWRWRTLLVGANKALCRRYQNRYGDQGLWCHSTPTTYAEGMKMLTSYCSDPLSPDAPCLSGRAADDTRRPCWVWRSPGMAAITVITADRFVGKHLCRRRQVRRIQLLV